VYSATRSTVVSSKIIFEYGMKLLWKTHIKAIIQQEHIKFDSGIVIWHGLKGAPTLAQEVNIFKECY